MSPWEEWILSSALRRFFQKHYEFPLWQGMLRRQGLHLGEAILEAGAGAGYGAELLYARRPQLLAVIDVRLRPPARQRLSRLSGVITQECSITDTRFAAATFSAVLAFGLFHHIIPQWPQAFAEIGRILRPGGVLLIGGEPARDVPAIGFERAHFLAEMATAGLRLRESRRMYGGFFEAHLGRRS